jgi:hypothetical protein
MMNGDSINHHVVAEINSSLVTPIQNLNYSKHLESNFYPENPCTDLLLTGTPRQESLETSKKILGLRTEMDSLVLLQADKPEG